MEGQTINPERPHDKKGPGSPKSHRPRASKIKAKQHPSPAPKSVDDVTWALEQYSIAAIGVV